MLVLAAASVQGFCLACASPHHAVLSWSALIDRQAHTAMSQPMEDGTQRWTPTRKNTGPPSWMRGPESGAQNVYGEMRNEYEEYAKRLDQSTSASDSGHNGKGFGGGEATRDPAPTLLDPKDPKGKQTAIHKAERFADYLAKRGKTF